MEAVLYMTRVVFRKLDLIVDNWNFYAIYFSDCEIRGNLKDSKLNSHTHTHTSCLKVKPE